MRAVLVVLAASGLVALAPGCGRPPAPAPAALSVEVSGCASVVSVPREGTGCVLGDDRAVRVVVASGEGALEATFAGAPVALGEEVPVDSGVRYTLRLPAPSGILVLRRGSKASAERASEASVRFVVSSRPAWYTEANAKRQSGDLAGALALAARGLEAPSQAERAAALGLGARVALRRGRVDEAADGLMKAIVLDEEAGLVSDRADDAFALVYLLHQRAARYAEARRVLSEIEPKLGEYPDGAARLPVYRAQLAWQTGDTRSALRDLELATSRADRLGHGAIARSARQVKSMVACSAGSVRTCLAGLREADRLAQVTEGVPPCERAELAVSLGFAEIEAAEGTGHVPAELGQADERALTLLGGACPDRYMQALAHQHLALVACQRRDAAVARRELAAAKVSAPEPRAGDAVTWLEIEARIWELEGKVPEALAGYDAARALARGAALLTKEVRALVAKGRLLAARGDRDRALGAFREAESLVDTVVATVPFGEGRASAAADGTEGVRLAAELQVRAGHAGEARDLLRHARGRLVASLSASARVATLDPPARAAWEERVAAYRAARADLDHAAAGDWKLSRAGLAAALVERKVALDRLQRTLEEARALLGAPRTSAEAPRPEGEVALLFARIGPLREVWGFVGEGERTRAFRVPEVTKGTSPDALGEALLAPAWQELSRASQVRIETDASLVGLDVHAATLRGEPLAVRVPVVYGTPLPALAPHSSGGKPRALVVADPTADLPAARSEGDGVASALASTHDVKRLTGRDATGPAVREALGEAWLLHYAGHGVFRGAEGEASYLPLGQGNTLTLGDVLTLPRAPRAVVLSGCETGREELASEEATLGLAQAFLVAGAEVVVAPATIVDDGASAELARALYTYPGDALAQPGDLPRRLQAARASAHRASKPWWPAFRVFAR